MSAVDETNPLDQPELLVRLNQDVGKLPKGLAYRLPSAVTHAFIARRLATPVGDLDTFADLELSEEELADVGITWAEIQSS
jgi:hypothetical protein